MKRVGAILHLVGAVLLAGLVAVQVFLAGNAILGVKFGNWGPHVELGRLLIWPILVLVLGALIGRLERRSVLMALALLLLYLLQFVLIYVPQQLDLTMLRGLHAVNALVISGIAGEVARQAIRQVRNR